MVLKLVIWVVYAPCVLSIFQGPYLHCYSLGDPHDDTIIGMHCCSIAEFTKGYVRIRITQGMVYTNTENVCKPVTYIHPVIVYCDLHIQKGCIKLKLIGFNNHNSWCEVFNGRAWIESNSDS